MAEVLTLGGKKYRQITQPTIENDFTNMALIRAAGLHEIELKSAEGAGEFAVEMLHRAIQSGKAFDLLAGFIIPDEKTDADWSLEIAAATAAHLKKLSDPEEKKAVQQHLAAMVVGFFQSGLSRFKISPKSSAEVTAPRESQAGELESADAPDSANGASS